MAHGLDHEEVSQVWQGLGRRQLLYTMRHALYATNHTRWVMITRTGACGPGPRRSGCLMAFNIPGIIIVATGIPYDF